MVRHAGSIDKLSSGQPGLQQFAEYILNDHQALRRYNEAKLRWIGDPDPSRRFAGDHPWLERHEGRRIYSHSVFSGYSIARQSLIHVAKDTWRGDSDVGAYFVGETSLTSDRVVEYEVQSSSVDRRRHLWLQIADPLALKNWPEGHHPSNFALPRDQNRLEIDLSPSYHASEAQYRAGLIAQVEFCDMIGLEAMMRQVGSRHTPDSVGDYQLVAA